MDSGIVALTAALGVILVQLTALVLSHLRSERITRKVEKVQDQVTAVQGKQVEDKVGQDEIKHLVNSHTAKLEARIQQLQEYITGTGGSVPVQPSPQNGGTGS